MKKLRDLGNSIIVVEHDQETMEEADQLIDIGPGAGEHGGEVVFSGTPSEIIKSPDSITGKYLSGKKSIEFSSNRRNGNGKNIYLEEASGNNLRNVSTKFPLEKLIVVTGVSGSGKSTLVNETLYPILSKELNGSRAYPLSFKSVSGLEYIDKVIDINQKPIGRTPRSNPATYTGVFTFIRDLFSQLPESTQKKINDQVMAYYKDKKFSAGTFENYQLRGTPSTLLIDKNGTLRGKWFGSGFGLETEIEKLLNE